MVVLKRVLFGDLNSAQEDLHLPKLQLPQNPAWNRYVSLHLLWDLAVLMIWIILRLEIIKFQPWVFPKLFLSQILIWLVFPLWFLLEFFWSKISVVLRRLETLAKDVPLNWFSSFVAGSLVLLNLLYLDGEVALGCLFSRRTVWPESPSNNLNFTGEQNCRGLGLPVSYLGIAVFSSIDSLQ